MTPLRFRAWHRKEKKIYHFHIFKDARNECGEQWYNCKEGQLSNGTEEQNYKSLDEFCDVMQSTGLFDKNGKEIFTKDVVEWEEAGWDCEKNEPCKITMRAQICIGEACVACESGYVGGHYIGFYLADKKGKQLLSPSGDSFDFPYLEEDIEIIGNIYEHPHLLPND